ncbi:MAG: hypothetical protein ACYCW6_11620, partial [Candidatus Xenobia bacterium]
MPFWNRWLKSGKEPEAPPPVVAAPAPRAFEPAPVIAGLLASDAQALLLEPEEDELLLLHLVDGALRPVESDAPRAALVEAARALDGQEVGGRKVAVWFGMTDFGDRIVVQFHDAESTPDSRKAERSATNRLLTTLR